jgi:hypothetical protein
MTKISDCKVALFALIFFAGWLFIGLPLLYLPSQDHVHGEILGVKYGEWLLFLATAGLASATWQLVTGAEKTAERQLRAYVLVEKATVFSITREGVPAFYPADTGKGHQVMEVRRISNHRAACCEPLAEGTNASGEAV